MTETFSDFDPADYLTGPATIAEFISDVLETGDAGYIAKALGVAVHAKGMTELARETGLSRKQLYRSFNKYGNPTRETTLAVLEALRWRSQRGHRSCDESVITSSAWIGTPTTLCSTRSPSIPMRGLSPVVRPRKRSPLGPRQ